MKFPSRLAFTLAALGLAGFLRAAELAGTSAEKQRQLITLIQSAAPASEKAVACKQLAVYGQAEAVPALAALLADPHLSSWARIPLEVIPGPAASAALREAAGRLQGNLLIGVINSIGVRRDPDAVALLVPKLGDAEAGIASAAAIALGRIGGEPAAQALGSTLKAERPAVRSVAAQGLILCAEQLIAAGQGTAAASLYDAVLAAEVPKQRKVEATRGTILARQAAGIPLLQARLNDPDVAYFDIALRTARELPGPEVTVALAAEIEKASAERQPLILLALADRTDPAVEPTVIKAARTGAPALRLAAVRVLEHVGDDSAVPVLLEAAVASDPALAKAARTTLMRLPGAAVDAALARGLEKAAGPLRLALIELCGQRHIEAALPAIVASLEDPGADVRRSALEAVGSLGGAAQVPQLVRLLAKTPAAERADIEAALIEVAGRAGTGSVRELLALLKDEDPGLRQSGIHALAGVGGTEALAAVTAAVADPQEAVQDEAVRTLATWPNNWPEDVAVAEPLLKLVKSSPKRAHQVLGVRGYLQYLQADKKLNDDARVAAVKDLAPSMQWPDQKQAAIALLGTLRTAGSLAQLESFAADARLTEGAWSAIVGLAGRDIPGVSREQRRAVLETIAAKSQNDATRKRANEAVKGLR